MVKVGVKQIRYQVVEMDTDVKSAVEAINEDLSLKGLKIIEDHRSLEIMNPKTAEVYVYSLSSVVNGKEYKFKM